MKGTKRGHGQPGFARAVRSRYWRGEDAQVVLDEWSSSGLELEELASQHQLDKRADRRRPPLPRPSHSRAPSRPIGRRRGMGSPDGYRSTTTLHATSLRRPST
jgi:hypothetical protein